MRIRQHSLAHGALERRQLIKVDIMHYQLRRLCSVLIIDNQLSTCHFSNPLVTSLYSLKLRERNRKSPASYVSRPCTGTLQAWSILSWWSCLPQCSPLALVSLIRTGCKLAEGGLGEAGRADVCVRVKRARSGSLWFLRILLGCLGNYFSAKITMHMVRLGGVLLMLLVHLPSAKLVLLVSRVCL